MIYSDVCIDSSNIELFYNALDAGVNFEEEHRKLWNWFAETPNMGKADYKDETGILKESLSCCFACIACDSCKNCPVTWLKAKHCSVDGSPYKMWVHATTPEEKAMYAKVIANLPWDKSKEKKWDPPEGLYKVLKKYTRYEGGKWYLASVTARKAMTEKYDLSLGRRPKEVTYFMSLEEAQKFIKTPFDYSVITIGDHFTRKTRSGMNEYVLASVGNSKMAMINIECGLPLADTVESGVMTEEKFKTLTDPFADEMLASWIPGNSRMSKNMNEWKQYRWKGFREMRPYITGEDVSHINISEADIQNGSPKEGDMIARNPRNHDDQWLVAKKCFEDNLEPA
ncbi:hypothetical protein KO465_04850 [Candidatus Micrarchaeota archaeon]|nr:hypothetical protein [Candidatus Micrarchaeota archaeon]